MTKSEAILISAYTGFLITQNFDDVHKFCEELLGRYIWTHEFAREEVWSEIREKCKPMIVKLIESQKDDSHFSKDFDHQKDDISKDGVKNEM